MQRSKGSHSQAAYDLNSQLLEMINERDDDDDDESNYVRAVVCLCIVSVSKLTVQGSSDKSTVQPCTQLIKPRLYQLAL